MKYAFIQRHKLVWPICVQCRVLLVSVSGYHQHLARRVHIAQRRHLSDEALLRIARVRGAAMADLGSPTGGMLAIAAPAGKVQALLNSDAATIVGYNSPRQTVVAGEVAALKHVAERAGAEGWQTSVLLVSHAFHTPLVAAAVPVLEEQLACESFARLERPIISTITGALLSEHEDLRALLCRQVTSPVQFSVALAGLLRAGNCQLPISNCQLAAFLEPRLVIYDTRRT